MLATEGNFLFLRFEKGTFHAYTNRYSNKILLMRHSIYLTASVGVNCAGFASVTLSYYKVRTHRLEPPTRPEHFSVEIDHLGPWVGTESRLSERCSRKDAKPAVCRLPEQTCALRYIDLAPVHSHGTTSPPT